MGRCVALRRRSFGLLLAAILGACLLQWHFLSADVRTPAPARKPAPNEITRLWLDVVQRAGRRPRDRNRILQVAQDIGLGPDVDLARVVVAHDFAACVDRYNLSSPRKMLKLADGPELRLFTPTETVDHAGRLAADGDYLQKAPPETSGVDFVFLGHHTLERLYDPWLAIAHLYEVMSEGGHIFMQAPLTSLPHKTSRHYFRFTAMGLAWSLRKAGFEVLEAGEWGSIEYEVTLFATSRWPGYGVLTNLNGNPGHVDVVWVLARKPAAPSRRRDLQAASDPLLFSRSPNEYAGVPVTERLASLWKSVVKPGRLRSRNESAMLQVADAVGLGRINDFPRIPAVSDFAEWADKYDLRSPRKLLRLGDDYELQLLSPHEVLERVYDPSTGANDLHRALPNVSDVDLVVSGQTLEHLHDPFRAVENLFAVMADGGYIFVSTPLVNIPHMAPSHYFHYTLMGLAWSLSRAGFVVVEAGQWGSRVYEMILFATMSWPGHGKLPSIAGDRGHVDQVWVLARKPETAAAERAPS